MQNRKSQARQVYAGMIGNVLEWYDFAVYSFVNGGVKSGHWAAQNQAI